MTFGQGKSQIVGSAGNTRDCLAGHHYRAERDRHGQHPTVRGRQHLALASALLDYGLFGFRRRDLVGEDV